MNNHQRDWQIINALRARALQQMTAAETPARREARTLRHILAHVPIFQVPGDRLAGDVGWREEDDDMLADRFPAADATPPFAPDTPQARLHADFHCFGGYAPGHTCIDYERLLRQGLPGILADIDAAGTSDYRESMSVALSAVQHLASRYAALAAQNGDDSLATLCRRVAQDQPRNFQEALQLIWLAHLGVAISEGSDASISLGRFDQYAYPFYRQSLAAGVTETELEMQFAALVDKLNRYGDAACALNLGGIDANGNDLCNDLTRLVARVVKVKRCPAPLLAARIHPDIPADMFDDLIDPALFAIGQPTFYGERSCRAAMRERGVPEPELARWAANSCMGLVVEGCEVSNMWSAVVNVLLPVELAVNQGEPFHRELPVSVGSAPLRHAETFEAVQAKVVEYLGDLIDRCIRDTRQCTERVRRERPNPYVSALLNRCIERGRDRLEGGADYSTAIVEAFGLINAADALYTIKTLVFDEQRYRLPELVDAARNNFRGADALYRDIRALPKYGNGNGQTDRLAGDLADHFQRLVRSHSAGDLTFAPSFHTLNQHIVAGKKLGASLDGRLDGEPLAKNIGTSPGAARAGTTALIRSAASIDQTSFFGGQALDVSIDANLLKSRPARRKMQDLLQTYFRLGGLQLQVNGLMADTLTRAIESPADYADLIVRIGGYSDYFNNLGIDVRREMARRAADGL